MCSEIWQVAPLLGLNLKYLLTKAPDKNEGRYSPDVYMYVTLRRSLMR